MPTEEKKSINWSAFILWPFLVGILYVLSSGPVVMVARQRGINRVAPSLIKFYEPIEWAYEKTPLRKPLGMYAHLWAPESFDKNGDSH
jgi:hypothetical protein